MLRVVVAALLVAGAVLASAAAAAAPAPPGRVFFLRGEQLAQVPRAGTSPAVALRHLIAGPTRAERALGFRSYVSPVGINPGADGILRALEELESGAAQ